MNNSHLGDLIVECSVNRKYTEIQINERLEMIHDCFDSLVSHLVVFCVTEQLTNAQQG